MFEVAVAGGHGQGFLQHTPLLIVRELLVGGDGVLILESSSMMLCLCRKHLHQAGIAIGHALGQVFGVVRVVEGEVIECERFRDYGGSQELGLPCSDIGVQQTVFYPIL